MVRRKGKEISLIALERKISDDVCCDDCWKGNKSIIKL